MASSLLDLLPSQQASKPWDDTPAQATQGYPKRMAELQAKGVPLAEAIIQCAEEGLIAPRMAEEQLKRLAATDALEPARDPSPPARSFPPSGPAADSSYGRAPAPMAPSGPGPKMDPAILAMLMGGKG